MAIKLTIHKNVDQKKHKEDIEDLENLYKHFQRKLPPQFTVGLDHEIPITGTTPWLSLTRHEIPIYFMSSTYGPLENKMGFVSKPLVVKIIDNHINKHKSIPEYSRGTAERMLRKYLSGNFNDIDEFTKSLKERIRLNKNQLDKFAHLPPNSTEKYRNEYETLNNELAHLNSMMNNDSVMEEMMAHDKDAGADEISNRNAWFERKEL